MEYVYDGLGRRIRETIADGNERSYTWSDTGWLTTVTNRQPEKAEHTTRLWVDVLGELATVNDTPLWWDSAAGSLDVIAIGDTPLLRTPGGITGVGNQWNIPGWRSERDTLHGDPWTANHTTASAPGTGTAGGDPFAGLSLPDGLALTTSGAVTVGGLEWMGHRAYDPTTRGFLSTDPLPPIPGTSWAANPYAFAGNDPVHALDPTGLSPITDTQLQAYRDGNHGVFAAAGDWLAHNWEYLAGGAMVIGGGALIATGVGGPVGGMLMAAGADVIIQKATTGSVNWTQTAVTAATGGLGELAAGTRVVTAIAGTGLRGAVTTGAVAGGVSGAAANAANYAISPGPHTIDGLMATTTEGALTGGALGAAGGAAGAALARGLSPVITKIGSNALSRISPRNEQFMDSFLAAGGTVRHSRTATAIGDDYHTMANFEKSIGADGYHDVILHGSEDGQFIVNGLPTNPHQIADAILENPHYTPGQPIRLVSCHAKTNTAGELEEILGVPILSDHRPVALDENGQLEVDVRWKPRRW
nr:RHS repeat-associated core domain-containing protein [Rathayibacter toxicus]